MNGQAVLRRKMGQAAVTPAAGRLAGIVRAWPLALARAARDGLDLMVEAGAPDLATRSLTEVLDLAPDLPLVAILEGAGEDLGVLFLSQPVLAGLIEAQTTGRVSAAPVAPRKPTRTDAAMVAGFVDRALAALDAALGDEDDLIWAGGFRYASFLDEVRPLGLILDDVSYRVLALPLGLAGGERAGPIVLALPSEGARRQAGARATGPGCADPVPFGRAGAGAGGVDHPPAVMGDQALEMTATLQAVLARPRLRLADVMGWAKGQVIPLPEADLTRIEVQGSDGLHLADGRLGQMQGMRAVRLTRIGQDRDGGAQAGPQPEAGPGSSGSGAGSAPGLPPLRSAARRDDGATPLPRTGTGG
ncbi:FliM/FliN family flagellar motor switch protein [Aliigemmobacter aestuarii]|uniref:FliM/FliN family flagellar motor switch protein n=1 Tax=Aliigemmobacter aestuarii TaxID=1445661 RepID=A0A4S3MM57_9RHOB|nr:FliM/FliN family flagellar motor C-terminal domain-containing protein [Gemmobacter aestuarii]THD82882.1 FliM/FliN family flagellar motor switch protein [Gemmobacter aestuarii]